MRPSLVTQQERAFLLPRVADGGLVTYKGLTLAPPVSMLSYGPDLPCFVHFAFWRRR